MRQRPCLLETRCDVIMSCSTGGKTMRSKSLSDFFVALTRSVGESRNAWSETLSALSLVENTVAMELVSRKDSSQQGPRDLWRDHARTSLRSTDGFCRALIHSFNADGLPVPLPFPQPDGAVPLSNSPEFWQEFLRWLSETEDGDCLSSEMSSCYESALTPVSKVTLDRSRRISQGSFYTPAWLAELAGQLAFQDLASVTGGMPRQPAVCDPSVGGGDFLVKVLSLARRSTQAGTPCEPRLVGVDVDEQALALTRFRLWFHDAVAPVLLRGDSLLALLPPSESGQRSSWSAIFREMGLKSGFDLVLGNPPYVRHEFIAPAALFNGKWSRSAYKRRVFSTVADRFGTKAALSGRSDLYAAFILLSVGLTSPRGVTSLVLSDSWLDAEFGDPIQEVLGKGWNRIAVPQAQRSFKDAGVSAMVLVHRQSGGVTALGPDSGAPGVTVRELPPPPVAPGGWGARFLRTPKSVSKLLEGIPAVPLEELVDLWYGSKLGITAFFMVTPGTRDRFRIESEFLRPILTSVRGLRTPWVSSQGCEERVFSCPYSLEQLDSQGFTGAAEYVRWGQTQQTATAIKHAPSARKWPEVASVAPNRPEWHCLSTVQPADFLFPALVHNRHLVLENLAGCLATNMFFCGRPKDPQHLEPLLALLNSSLGCLQMELAGRSKGFGGLNLYGREVRRLPVPDPRGMSATVLAGLTAAWREAQRSASPSARDGSRSAQSGQRSTPAWKRILDGAVAETLGISAEELDLVRSALDQTVGERIQRGAFSGDPTSGSPVGN